jgi:hypothetical protein
MSWFGRIGVDRYNLQAQSVSTDIRAIPTNVSTPAGESRRVLTTVSEDGSRVKWLCHRYVERRGGSWWHSRGIFKGQALMATTNLRMETEDEG